MSSATCPCGKRSGMIAITVPEHRDRYSGDRDQLIGIIPESVIAITRNE
jgi:hypothetical protein